MKNTLSAIALGLTLLGSYTAQGQTAPSNCERSSTNIVNTEIYATKNSDGTATLRASFLPCEGRPPLYARKQHPDGTWETISTLQPGEDSYEGTTPLDTVNSDNPNATYGIFAENEGGLERLVGVSIPSAYEPKLKTW